MRRNDLIHRSRGHGAAGRSYRRRQGFTLVEMIAVMVIVAIVAATAAPALHTVGEIRAKSAARLLERDLTFMRQHAVAAGYMCWADFDIGNDQWLLFEDVPGGAPRTNAAPLNDPMSGTPFVQVLGADPFQDVEIVTVDFDGRTTIGFDWIGRPFTAVLNGGGSYTVNPLTAVGTITLTGNRQATIEPDTGAIELILP